MSATAVWCFVVLQVGTPSVTGRTCCQGERSSEWGWRARFTTGQSGNRDLLDMQFKQSGRVDLCCYCDVVGCLPFPARFCTNEFAFSITLVI